ncbi:MAG: hypothetical protein ACJA1A_002151 [Saprospiraceae bacterium]|jgi:hypothetical protein
MKNNILAIFSILLLLNCSSNSNSTVPDAPTVNISKQLRHIVLFKFKEASSKEEIQKIETAFSNLPSKIEQIKDFEWGLNNSPEGLNKDFTHCFLVTFDNEEDRAIYLPHPAHKEFVSLLEPYLEDVLVLDYWSK